MIVEIEYRIVYENKLEIFKSREQAVAFCKQYGLPTNDMDIHRVEVYY